jgi:alcohol dehydrogenase class IV
MISKFSFPIPVLFGPGAVEGLREELASRGVRRPMMVSSRDMVGAPALKRVQRALGECVVFTGLDPEPAEQSVMDGAECFVMEGCDGLVAAGGGPVIDAAKAIRLKVHHPLPLSGYSGPAAGVERITAEMPPCLAVPLSGGRGSEVDDCAVIRIPKHRKLITLRSQFLLPSAAIVDPELTIELGPAETAACGMESLAQSIESHLSRTFHPVCGAIAMEAARLVLQHLGSAVTNGRNIEARSALALSSLMAGIASQKGAGAARSMILALVLETHVSAGAAAAMVLPAVLEFNREQSAHDIERLTRCLGVEDLTAALGALRRETGTDVRLRSLGVAEEALPGLAQAAFTDHAHHSNPRPCTVEDFAALFRQAW